MKELAISCIIIFELAYIGYSQEITSEDITSARKIRRMQLDDPIRPSWHLTIAEGRGYPFDPNGAIFKNGIYHLWYLYQNDEKHQWQHLSSIDLFHWRWHSNDLLARPGDPEYGIFSGNAFFAKDGNVVIAYHGLGSEGNCVAYSSDDELKYWTKSADNPISTPGWDPHMWVEGDTYNLISGGKPGSSYPEPPMLYKGDTYNKPLKYSGKFMTHDMPGIDGFEDISCPDFFKIEDKWALVCISHARGARYYVGTWDGNQFYPESHHRMNWPGGTLFAPETLLDDKGRRILWTWVIDRRSGVSSGVMSMPRVLRLAEDKLSLTIEPPKEIENLRYNLMKENSFAVEAAQPHTFKNIKGNSIEIDITINPREAKRLGVKVFCSKNSVEQTPILIDRNNNIIQIDMSQSSLNKPDYNEFVMPFAAPGHYNQKIDTQDAPFSLKPNEKIKLRIFLDKSMLEVFVNNRQCVTQVIYPTLEDAIHVQVFTDDAPIIVEEAKAWKLFPAIQW